MENGKQKSIQYDQINGSGVYQPPRRKLMARPRKERSWRAPAIMASTLLGGLIVAIAHHLMNHFVNGRPVDNVSRPQVWVTRFATAFAFLVKVLFATTTGVAFVQRQWTTFSKRSFAVQEVDSITGVLGEWVLIFSKAQYGSKIHCSQALLSSHGELQDYL